MPDRDPFWSLPGPSRFISDIAESLLGSHNGIALMDLPRRRPARLIDNLVAALQDVDAGHAVKVNATDPVFERSIAHGLARCAGSTTTVSSIASLLDAPDVSTTIFVVDAVNESTWTNWAAFLKGFRHEWQRKDRSLAPLLLLSVPQGLSSDRHISAMGNTIAWRSYVQKIDTQMYVSSLGMTPPSTLLERLRSEIIIEFTGWDLEFANQLLELRPRQILNPVAHLEVLERSDFVASWSGGDVDLWNGVAFESTRSILKRGDKATLFRRLHLAYVHAVMPMVSDVVQYFCQRYRKQIESKLPYSPPGNGVPKIHDLHALEPVHLYRILSKILPEVEAGFLRSVTVLRNFVSHNRIPDPDMISTVSRAWETLQAEDGNLSAWSWPRCGQTLILQFGGEHGKPDINPGQNLIERLKKTTWDRLGQGQDVIIEASGLTSANRLDLLSSVPSDISVEYHVFDQSDAAPLGLPGSYCGGDIASVLRGDADPRVRVEDMRNDKAVYRQTAKQARLKSLNFSRQTAS